jgi:hypothetical protein
MDIGWAWRHESLEHSTLELSTKVLEYAACGLAPLLARGPVNASLFGEAYPFFVDSGSLVPLLRGALGDRRLVAAARDAASAVAAGHAYARVGRDYLRPLLDAWPVPDRGRRGAMAGEPA